MTRARDNNRVKRRREDLGLSLKELAAAADCNPALVSMIQGGFVPQLRTMRKIAAALETTADKLWPDEFEPIPEDEV